MKIVGIPYLMNGDKLVPPVVIWPDRCPCCGDASNTLFRHRHRARARKTDYSETTIAFYPVEWQVPYCKRCKSHTSLSENLPRRVLLVLLPLSLVGLLFLYLAPGPIFGGDTFLSIIVVFIIWAAMVMAVAAITSWILKRMLVYPKISSTCIGEDKAVSVSDDAEKFYFHFLRADQAEMFAQMNRSEALDFIPQKPKPETASELIIRRYRRTYAWLVGILTGIVFLLASLINPLDGVPSYQLITKEDYSIIFAFLFSFLVGAMVGALLGSWLGTRAGKKAVARQKRI